MEYTSLNFSILHLFFFLYNNSAVSLGDYPPNHPPLRVIHVFQTLSTKIRRKLRNWWGGDTRQSVGNSYQPVYVFQIQTFVCLSQHCVLSITPHWYGWEDILVAEIKVWKLWVLPSTHERLSVPSSPMIFLISRWVNDENCVNTPGQLTAPAAPIPQGNRSIVVMFRCPVNVMSCQTTNLICNFSAGVPISGVVAEAPAKEDNSVQGLTVRLVPSQQSLWLSFRSVSVCWDGVCCPSPTMSSRGMTPRGVDKESVSLTPYRHNHKDGYPSHDGGMYRVFFGRKNGARLSSHFWHIFNEMKQRVYERIPTVHCTATYIEVQ